MIIDDETYNTLQEKVTALICSAISFDTTPEKFIDRIESLQEMLDELKHNTLLKQNA